MSAIDRVARFLDPDVFKLKAPGNRAILIPPVNERATKIVNLVFNEDELVQLLTGYHGIGLTQAHKIAEEYRDIINGKEPDGWKTSSSS